jgi:Holin of 3TMs, for gene-transfer release
MGILSFLSGANPFAAVADATIGKVVDKALAFIPDPKQQADFLIQTRQLDLTEEKQQMDAATQQIAVNIEEAKSQRWWDSGARPFILWICGAALGYNYILQPLLTFFVRIWLPEFAPPVLQIADLIGLLTGLLGLGYLRSQDKAAVLGAKP